MKAFLRFLILFCLPFHVMAQEVITDRRIMRRHENGREHVVLYFTKETDEMVKEEVYFPNGRLHWSGTYKNMKENGSWQFYHENGKLRSTENYVNGKEHGICTKYDESGRKLSESFWKHGKLLREQKF